MSQFRSYDMETNRGFTTSNHFARVIWTKGPTPIVVPGTYLVTYAVSATRRKAVVLRHRNLWKILVVDPWRNGFLVTMVPGVERLTYRNIHCHIPNVFFEIAETWKLWIYLICIYVCCRPGRYSSGYSMLWFEMIGMWKFEFYWTPRDVMIPT